MYIVLQYLCTEDLRVDDESVDQTYSLSEPVDLHVICWVFFIFLLIHKFNTYTVQLPLN